MNTPSQNEEIVRRACIAANPAIMELGFGCEFKDKDVKHLIFRADEGDSMLQTLALTKFYGVDEVKIHHIGRDYVEGKLPDVGIPEILGRPIRLADVLYALGSHSNKGTSGRTILIESNSGLFVEEMRDYNKSYQTHWNLLKDSLHDQSPETLAFLASLLVEK